MKINRENVSFVLVEPNHPGNVGAAARALKTMGFRNLILVNPCDHLSPEARWLAHASEDILENARVFSNLKEALVDVNFAVATTQRPRSYHFPFYTPRELGEKFIPLTQEHRVALVFGREASGLTNEEIRCCHAITTIPAAQTHPSLNLAQAVMLYSYELFQASYAGEKEFNWQLAGYEELEGLFRHLEESLRRVEFVPRDSWESFLMRFRRFFARANPEVRDVNLMHKILQSFEQYIDQVEKKK